MTDKFAEGEALAIETFGSSNPGPGCTFISPDGTFVNIYPKLKTHEDLCEWVEEQLDIELPYRDEEYFVREFNWVRLRSDPNMSIIMLPKDSLFRNQWYSLEDWLTYIEERYPNGCRLYLETCDGPDTDVEYKFGTEYFAEDIIKICRRYYSSGKLYMSKEINSMKKKYIKASRLNFDFFDWYNNILTDSQQAAVDECADELGCPEYTSCTDSDLAKIFYHWARTRYNSNELNRRYARRELVEASSGSAGDQATDTYVVKIWHEIEADPESMNGPVAAEEIFEVAATSYQEALELAKQQWSGPIDRIEVVDVNPEPDEYEVPFTSSTSVCASTQIKPNGKIQEGMYWSSDWHHFTVDSVSPDRKTCKITEEWINEDTGEEMKYTYNCKIVQDESGEEYAYDPKYEEELSGPYGQLFKWWASGALNYPYGYDGDGEDNFEDGDSYDDNYIPSATAGDYSPSNPWDAPGMSIRDFI